MYRTLLLFAAVGLVFLCAFGAGAGPEPPGGAAKKGQAAEGKPVYLSGLSGIRARPRGKKWELWTDRRIEVIWGEDAVLILTGEPPGGSKSKGILPRGWPSFANPEEKEWVDFELFDRRAGRSVFGRMNEKLKVVRCEREPAKGDEPETLSSYELLARTPKRDWATELRKHRDAEKRERERGGFDPFEEFAVVGAEVPTKYGPFDADRFRRIRKAAGRVYEQYRQSWFYKWIDS